MWPKPVLHRTALVPKASSLARTSGASPGASKAWMSGREQIETPRENVPGKKGLARPIPNGGAYAGPVPPGLTWTLSDASTVGLDQDGEPVHGGHGKPGGRNL